MTSAISSLSGISGIGGVDALKAHRVVRLELAQHGLVVGARVLLVGDVGEHLEIAAGDVLEQQRGGEALAGGDRQLQHLAVAQGDVDADALGL